LGDGRRCGIRKGVERETLRGGIGSPSSHRDADFPAASKVYLCTVPCDMPRSFDGLSMMADHHPVSVLGTSAGVSATGGVIE